MHISCGFLILSCGYMLATADRSNGRHSIVLYFDGKAENFTEPDNSTSYNIGDIIEAYCIQNSTSYIAEWLHVGKKDNIYFQLGHMDHCRKRKCVLKMTLESIDYNTDLLCRVHVENGEPVVSKSQRIVLNDIHQKISKKEEIVKNSPYYTIQCDENDFSVYIFPNGTKTCNRAESGKVDKNNKKSIENNTRALCITFENSNLEKLLDYDVFTRRIYNRKIFTMDAIDKHEGNFPNWTIVGSICSGAVIVVALVLYSCTRVYSKPKKRDRTDEDSCVHVYEDIELPSTANSTEHLDYSYSYDHRIRANRTGKSFGSCFGSR